jgi:5-methylcytosine-specific restriction endonuclease McrA
MPYKDPEQRRAYGREWMRLNPEKAREAMRRWRQRHPEEHNAEARLFYRRHTEELKTRNAAYQAAHPDVYRTAKQRYRARKVAAEGSYTTAEWMTVLEAAGNVCSYCGGSGPLVAEHRVPLSRGGTNEITNIVAACAPCNNRKHRLTDDEFRARLSLERGDEPPAATT